MVIVKYSAPNLRTVPPPHGAQGVLSFNLNPGINQVPDQAWAHAEKLPLIAGLLKAGTIKVVRRIADKPGDPNALRSVSPAQAAKLVGETYHLPTLREWKSSEKREPVLKAIDTQIELVNAQAKADDEKITNDAGDDEAIPEFNE